MTTETLLDFTSYDPEQVKMMAEMCIRVTEDDEIVEPISKKESHLMENIESNRALHRAFSVFIFNAENRLLLQQRSMDKITFPGYWTNTCCSHPLWKEDELNGRDGVCVAAVRKLDQEMGITSVKVSDFTYLCRILYKAPSDGIWGEHEVDYILIVKQKETPVVPNPNEVMATRYVTPEQLQELFKQAESGEVKITPWFQLICKNFLFGWWKNLDNLQQFCDPKDKIHKLY